MDETKIKPNHKINKFLQMLHMHIIPFKHNYMNACKYLQTMDETKIKPNHKINKFLQLLQIPNITILIGTK